MCEHFLAEGADSWFERPAEDFLPGGYTCAKCGGTGWLKERDILDVWFDSGCSHIAVLRTRPELTWPAGMYIEGHDQHRGWFQSSLLVGTGIEGGAPFQQVVTCGFIVNEQGEKLSKSSGKALSAQDVIKQNGSDILRLWVTSLDYRDDLPFGPHLIGRVAESYRKIRNTARYLLANLHDFEPERDALPLDQLFDADKWALARAADAFARCRRAYEEYEFHVVYHRMLELCTVDLSALYIDIAKDTTYCDAPDSPSRRSAQTAMYEILRSCRSPPTRSMRRCPARKRPPFTSPISHPSRRRPRISRRGSASSGYVKRCRPCSSGHVPRSRSARRSRPTSLCIPRPPRSKSSAT